MRLLTLELKKLLFSKKALVLMSFLIIAVVYLFLQNLSLQHYIVNEERQLIEERLATGFENSSLHQGKLDKFPEDPQEQQLLEINSSIISTLYELRQAIVTDDWQQKLTLDIQLLEDVSNYKKAGGYYDLTDTEIRHQLALKQKLLDEDIPPEHDSFSLALPNFMKQIIEIYVPIGAIVMIILLIGDTLTAEYEGHSIKLLFTQPIKRSQIITSKFISSFIGYLMGTIMLIISIITMGSIFGEKGTFDYPVVMELNNEIEFLTILEYVIYSLIILTAIIVLLISLQFLYSLIFKHTVLTTFILLVTLLAGYVMTSLVSWNFFSWVNPFQYLASKETILIQNSGLWYYGLPVMFLTAMVLYFITIRKIQSDKIG